MNRILEARATAISRSFRELDRCSPTREIIKHMIKEGKIDVSQPPEKARDVVMNYFLKEGVKYNMHIPFFSKKGGEISVFQEDLFDTFVLASVFSAFLRGIDQYPAGACMFEHGFEQFSVFCHYTSIYQLVNAALSMHGICFVAKPISGQKVETVNTEMTAEGKKRDCENQF